MEIISESQNLESKEMLPQILLRIFTICKTDPNFPLKNQIHDIEGKVKVLQAKLKRQAAILEKSKLLRENLQHKVSTLDQKNVEIKSALLEELGSEI